MGQPQACLLPALQLDHAKTRAGLARSTSSRYEQVSYLSLRDSRSQGGSVAEVACQHGTPPLSCQVGVVRRYTHAHAACTPAEEIAQPAHAYTHRLSLCCMTTKFKIDDKCARRGWWRPTADAVKHAMMPASSKTCYAGTMTPTVHVYWQDR